LITVLATHQTERLTYTLTELFQKRLGIAFTVTTNVDYFNATNGAKINYTSTQLNNCINILPQALLYHNGITIQQIDVKKDKKWHTLLWPNSNAHIPFDVFAASFYLLSRYEEYTNKSRDQHGRFEAKNSLAFNHGFLDFPLIEHWCEQLKNVLQSQYHNLTFKPNTFKSITTIDIDFAYLYKGLSAKRWLGKLAKSILRFDIKSIQKQLLSSFDIKRDPYNTYDFISATVRGELGYFILMSNKGGYDKNIKTDGTDFKKLIKQLHKRSDFIGLHPSYASNQNIERLLEERIELGRIIKQKIETSRQHFLKMNLPETYRNLIKVDIKEDYTMTYAEQIGFRASTCLPFVWFDLQMNMATQLVCFPTCFMDTTAIEYLKYDAEQIENLNEKLLNLIKNYNGYYVTLWHNNTFVSPHVRQTFCNLYNKI
jgi:hypothetical protein